MWWFVKGTSHQRMASEFRTLQSPMQQRKQHSQISGLLVASMSNNQISDDQDDVTGRDVNICDI